MITEDQLEQLAIQWFQDTGWNYVHGAVIAPEGVAAEREDFRAVVLKGRLAEAVRRLNPKLPESAVVGAPRRSRPTEDRPAEQGRRGGDRGRGGCGA
jgi:type I restriction enzyme, R subunit